MVEKKKVVAKKRTAKKTVKSEIKTVSTPRSDNEKAILISLAYLIGFVTAYIAFMVNEPASSRFDGHLEQDYTVLRSDFLAASGAVRAFANEEGLFVSNHGFDRIISAKADAEEYEPGFHQQIVATNVSPDGNYVHYCAVMSVDTQTCSHFVYVVDQDKVYRVTHLSQALDTSSQTTLTAAWTSSNLLQIGEYVSVNAATPWVLE